MMMFDFNKHERSTFDGKREGISEIVDDFLNKNDREIFVNVLNSGIIIDVKKAFKIGKAVIERIKKRKV